ncbi:MAG: iron-sulfur cluster repair di-iron protein [Candidatus Obscuribacterales bacterium]|nr:iron-sulfur cluster repair di-iron protein [Candidatus Obscuribacterales bacterium]
MKELRHEAVGLLVAEQPLRAAVFDRFGIDFCCGGKLTLLDACQKAGIRTEVVIENLLENDAHGAMQDSPESWLNASLTELTNHIQQTHHAYLKLELPRLQALAKKVARVHGAKDSRLVELAAIFSSMKQEIEQHTMKEDNILFPYMRQLEQGKDLPKAPFGTVANPVRCLESEHNDAGEALMRLRDLTDQYVAPEGACTSWLALLAGLAHLDQDLRTHIHQENSILFPKAIKAESVHAHC